jgi:phage-related protein
MAKEVSSRPLKPLTWMGSSRKDFANFPEEVRSEMGYALFMAQCGERHRNAKPLAGFGVGRRRGDRR